MWTLVVQFFKCGVGLVFFMGSVKMIAQYERSRRQMSCDGEIFGDA